MLTVVTWKWGALYSAEHVARLRAALQTHLPLPHRFVCLMDTPLDGIETLAPPPLPPHALTLRYRKLAMYDVALGLGSRVLYVDLDILLVADIRPLIDRPEPLVVWRGPSRNRMGYVFNSSLVLWTGGYLDSLWQQFKKQPDLMNAARQAGWSGSDQGVLSWWVTTHALPHGEWTAADGVIGYVDAPENQRIPTGAKVISFHRAPGVGPHPGKPTDVPAWVTEQWPCLP